MIAMMLKMYRWNALGKNELLHALELFQKFSLFAADAFVLRIRSLRLDVSVFQ